MGEDEGEGDSEDYFTPSGEKGKRKVIFWNYLIYHPHPDAHPLTPVYTPIKGEVIFLTFYEAILFGTLGFCTFVLVSDFVLRI